MDFLVAIGQLRACDAQILGRPRQVAARPFDRTGDEAGLERFQIEITVEQIVERYRFDFAVGPVLARDQETTVRQGKEPAILFFER